MPVAVNSHGIAILDPQWLCANFSTIFSARRSWSINKGYDELGVILFIFYLILFNLILFNFILFNFI